MRTAHRGQHSSPVSPPPTPRTSPPHTHASHTTQPHGATGTEAPSAPHSAHGGSGARARAAHERKCVTCSTTHTAAAFVSFLSSATTGASPPADAGMPSGMRAEMVGVAPPMRSCLTMPWRSFHAAYPSSVTRPSHPRQSRLGSVNSSSSSSATSLQIPNRLLLWCAIAHSMSLRSSASIGRRGPVPPTCSLYFTSRRSRARLRSRVMASPRVCVPRDVHVDGRPRRRPTNRPAPTYPERP